MCLFIFIIQFHLANRFDCLFSWFEIDVTKLVFSTSIEIYDLDYLNCFYIIFSWTSTFCSSHGICDSFPENDQFDIHLVIVLIVFVCGWKFVAQTLFTMDECTRQFKSNANPMSFTLHECLLYVCHLRYELYYPQFMQIEIYSFGTMQPPAMVKSLTSLFLHT